MRRIILTILLLSFSSQIFAMSLDETILLKGCDRQTMKIDPAEKVPASYSYRYISGFPAEDRSVSNEGAPSSVREALFSFLVPGLGQYRLNKRLRSRVYFTIEGLTWVAIGSFLWMGYAREKAYKDYAVAYAGVRSTSFPDDYYSVIGQYLSSDGPGGYNEYIRREARDMYYPDRDAIDRYYSEHSYTGEMTWRWRSYEYFRKYNVLRDGSESAYRNALYTVMFALIVRVVSSVDAAFLAKADGSAEESNFSLRLGEHRGNVMLYLGRSF